MSDKLQKGNKMLAEEKLKPIARGYSCSFCKVFPVKESESFTYENGLNVVIICGECSVDKLGCEHGSEELVLTPERIEIINSLFLKEKENESL